MSTPLGRQVRMSKLDFSNWLENGATRPPRCRQETLEAFRLAFKSLGFVDCETPDIGPGVEKIAIYSTADGRPTHAARQLSDGSWTSKLGRLHDITHDLSALTGPIYGSPALFMSRPI